MKARILAGVLLGSLVLVPAQVGAQNNKNRKKVYPLTRKGAASELPTIKRVSGRMITVSGKSYQVSDDTEITVNGERGSLRDLRPGMQVSVTGGVLEYGRTKSDTIYKATRITATRDNKLEAKRKDYNKKQAEKARKINQSNNRNRNRH